MNCNSVFVIILLVMSIDQADLAIVTKRFNLEKLSALKENIGRHFQNDNSSDVQSILTSNWYFERYLHEYNYSVKASERAIIASFDYFHRERLDQLGDTYFPSELYAVGGVYRFGRSKFGQHLFGAVMSRMRPMGARLLREPTVKLIQKFWIYNIYKSVFEAKEKNLMAYVVFTNTTLDNTELSFFTNSLMFLSNHLPGVPLKMYLVGLNKLTELTVKLFSNFVRPSLKARLAFVERMDQMEDLIDLHEVPTHAGGYNTEWSRVPPNVTSGQCLAHLRQIRAEEWNAYRELNSDAISEGMRRTNDKSVDHYLQTCRTNISS